MAVSNDFFVNDGVSNKAYTRVPPYSTNASRYAKKTPEVNGAKSTLEFKFTEDGKGPTAQTHYAMSKTFEVLGVDNALRAARVNLAIHIPATSPGVNRPELVKGLLCQIISLLMTDPATAESVDGPEVAFVSEGRVSMILNGEI